MSTEESAIPIHDMLKLWKLCSKFIKEQKISCPETIYQCDWVIENSYELVAKIAEIVGYNEESEE